MPNEISARRLRENLAAALNEVAVRGQTLYVTNHGRRIAAIVPVPVAEQVESRRPRPEGGAVVRDSVAHDW